VCIACALGWALERETPGTEPDLPGPCSWPRQPGLDLRSGVREPARVGRLVRRRAGLDPGSRRGGTRHPRQYRQAAGCGGRLQKLSGRRKTRARLRVLKSGAVFLRRPLVPDAAWRELAALTTLFGELKRLHDGLDLSWIYLATVNESFAIYPFLPLSDAVNNDKPTRQVFYTSAGFATRTTGWTPPYLDLAGAGMMVTAAFPVYDGDTLLGVASRDITLKQIASALDAAAPHDTVAALMDGDGLVVAASGKYAEEIETTGGAGGKATLHYRRPEALRDRDTAETVSSMHEFLNAAGEAAVDKARGLAPAEAAAFELPLKQSRYHVIVRKARTNGWLVLGVEPI